MSQPGAVHIPAASIIRAELDAEKSAITVTFLKTADTIATATFVGPNAVRFYDAWQSKLKTETSSVFAT